MTANQSPWRTYTPLKDQDQDQAHVAPSEDGEDAVPDASSVYPSPHALVQGLADGLPDPPEDSSDDDEEDQGELNRQSSTGADLKSREQSASNPTEKIPSAVVDSVEPPPEQSADASAALLNNFVSKGRSNVVLLSSNVPQRASKPRTSSGKLKGLSDGHGKIYKGIGPSGTQRRLPSNAKTTFDLEDTEHPEPLMRQAKAPSVDPASISWAIRDTAAAKKRKLSPQTDSARVQGLHTADPDFTRRRMIPKLAVDSPGFPQAGSKLYVDKRQRRPVEARPNDGSNTGPANALGLGIRSNRTVATLNSAEIEPIRKGNKQLNGTTSSGTSQSENVQITDNSARGSDQVHPEQRSAETAADNGLPQSEARNMPKNQEAQINDVEASQNPTQSKALSSQGGQVNSPRAIAPNGHLERPDEAERSALDSLKAAFTFARKIGFITKGGRHSRVHLPMVKTSAAKEVVQACKQANIHISRLEAGRDEDANEPGSDLGSFLEQAMTKAYKVVSESCWDENKDAVRDVYVHVLPKLTILLRDLLRHYEASSIDKLSKEQLKISNLLTTAIVVVGSKAGKVKSKIATDFPIKGAVKDGIVKNIRAASKYFDKRLYELEGRQLEEEARRQAETVRRRAAEERARLEEIRRAEEEAEKSQEARERVFEEWAKKWAMLHSERLQAELNGRMISKPSKLKHLRVVPLDKSPAAGGFELDANGEPIERVQLFTERTSQPPGHKARGPRWNSDQMYALLCGLRDFSGPRVYQNIFQRHCRYGELLHDYSVSEIVDQAMWLREKWVDAAQEESEAPEEWILRITDPRLPPDVSDI